MTELEFNALAAQGYNRIPWWRRNLRRPGHPLNLYLSWRMQPCAAARLPDGVRGGRRALRALNLHRTARTHRDPPAATPKCCATGRWRGRARAIRSPSSSSTKARFQVALRPGMPRFCGGLAGYFGYDTVRHIEPRQGPAVKPFPARMGGGTPDIRYFSARRASWSFSTTLGKRMASWCAPTRQQPESLQPAPSGACGSSSPEAQASGEHPGGDSPRQRASAERATSRQGRLPRGRGPPGMHRRGRLHAGAGGPGHQPSATRDSPLSLYRALRSLNPSPYMYYYELRRLPGGGRLARDPGAPGGHRARTASSSQITIRPLAGTRKRGATPEEDAALAAEDSQADPKEIAEHVMLIDLRAQRRGPCLPRPGSGQGERRPSR